MWQTAAETALGLNAQGVVTVQGKAWTTMQGKRVLERV
jgi:hypothetical protein